MVPLARKEKPDLLDHLVGLYSRDNRPRPEKPQKEVKIVLTGYQGSPRLRVERGSQGS